MPINEIGITLAHGPRTRAVTPEALAHELGLATVRPALLALFLRPDDPQLVPSQLPTPLGEGGEGERSVEHTFGPNVHVNVSPNKYIVPENVGTERSFSRLAASSRDASASARHLAHALDDLPSIAWYQQVTEALDPIAVGNALSTALQVPAWKLRKSRAAVFTSIVAPLVKQARNAQIPQQYAQTPTPP